MNATSVLENWGQIFKITPIWLPKWQDFEEYLAFCSLLEQIEADLKLLVLKWAWGIFFHKTF